MYLRLQELHRVWFPQDRHWSRNLHTLTRSWPGRQYVFLSRNRKLNAQTQEMLLSKQMDGTVWNDHDNIPWKLTLFRDFPTLIQQLFGIEDWEWSASRGVLKFCRATKLVSSEVPYNPNLEQIEVMLHGEAYLPVVYRHENRRAEETYSVCRQQ